MRCIIILLLIAFSCKKEKKDSAVHKSEVFSVETVIDSVQNKVVLDTIKSIVRNDTLVFQLKNLSISFIDRKDDCWKSIQIKNLQNKVLTEIETPKEICFERNRISDFSPNQKYLLLHAIERGILSDGNSVEEVEKYNCMFLDIENKIVSEKYSDLFCSGEWKNLDQWMVDEEESYDGKDLFKN
ncbi:hypothetical protein [Aquimarina sp. MMG016]|uniref:hypothetical protein n=1 Tax=Aquimarina sp. MMG016 TaxID=2822690 RepID=UPI001B3A4EEF|nr:hypothetical protein [Aquimarina sp. MMG016]MBQ4819637.1 hypothetical protein [Aquimarina sp. MMG016]